MNATLLAGATCVLQRRFVAERALTACITHGVTLFFAVPTVYIALLAIPFAPACLQGVRYYFSAAATLPMQVERNWYERTGIHIHEGYGLTETSPGASYNHVRAWKNGSVGAPVTGVQMRVVDAERRPLADGEIGEICIKGPNVMLGYYRREDDSARAIVDGWFHTGDIGYRDADGDYFIVDRLKDMINVSGFKVWPREVEEVLFHHDAVRESAVVGVPDAYSGEAVKAFIVLNEEVSVEELRAHCRAWLSAYKVPKQLEIVDSIPKNATGKVLKTTLRTLDLQTTDVHAAH
jgi:long-chain acyl-CoA synthetase